MSCVASKPDERVEVETRRAFRRADIAAAMIAQAGRCPDCRMKIPPFESDHGIARGLGGKTEAANLVLRCPQCHALKTKNDRKAIDKAKRLAGETKITPTKRPLQSRGFDRSRTRHFDGSVTLKRTPKETKNHA